MRISELKFKQKRNYVRQAELIHKNGTLLIKKGEICRTDKGRPYEVDFLENGAYASSESYVTPTRLQEILDSFGDSVNNPK